MDRKRIVTLLKILVSGIFILSAIAKMFPLWAFEKQLVDLKICDWCFAYYLARFIIGLELALGLAILQKNLLRKVVLPLTAFLLIIFCIHLVYQMYLMGPMSGNCGCFGQLIPMTPLEAFIKNIITLLILFFIFKLSPVEEPKNVYVLMLFWALSTLLVFICFPFCPCQEKLNIMTVSNPRGDIAQDSTSVITKSDTPVAMVAKEVLKKDTTAKKSKAPKPVKSIFTEYTNFSGQNVDLNEGKKIVCLYNPNCDHCLETATRMSKLAKKMNLPPVYVVFLNEEIQEIPNFYAKSGSENLPYIIVEPKEFFSLSNGAFPSVYYLWNGNVLAKFEGDKEFAFTEAKMKSVLLKY